MKALIISKHSKPRPIRLTTYPSKALLSANGKSGFTRRSRASAPLFKTFSKISSLRRRTVVTLPPAPTSKRTTFNGESVPLLCLASSLTCCVQVSKRSS
eukprot:Skav202368  [mRNA]  locus=scaffold1406:62468:62764:- [translate_table: standard]